MSKYNELKSQVLPLVAKDAIMDNIYMIQGKELDGLTADKDSLLQQLFADSATWGLQTWEKFLGIPTELEKSDEERRGAIKSKLLGTKVFTTQMVKDMAMLFGYTVAFIQENTDPYVVQIKLASQTDFVKVRSFIAAMDDVKPAHIQCMYLYNLSTWGDLQSSMINYNMLSKYKWSDFLTTGLGDGAYYKTEFLKLKQWKSDDIFLYSDLNFNFEKMDALFGASAGHTHNGTDSPRVDSQHIKFDATKTVNDRMIELSSFVGSTSEGKIALAQAIGSPALPTKTMAALNTDITNGKTSIASAITAKGTTTVKTDTFAQMADNVRSLVGTVIPNGNALPEEVRIGKTFVNSAGKQTGTAKVRSGLTLTVSHSGDYLLDGFQDGTCVIKGEVNLLPENILKGVNICGVTGTMGDPDYVDGSTIDSSKLRVNRDSYGNIQSYTILP